jgi:hypothetical protein
VIFKLVTASTGIAARSHGHACCMTDKEHERIHPHLYQWPYLQYLAVLRETKHVSAEGLIRNSTTRVLFLPGIFFVENIPEFHYTLNRQLQGRKFLRV